MYKSLKIQGSDQDIMQVLLLTQRDKMFYLVIKFMARALLILTVTIENELLYHRKKVKVTSGAAVPS